jgi:4-amino-4-deoxy-L-arabinose transferase-like glycosyltransferase
MPFQNTTTGHRILLGLLLVSALWLRVFPLTLSHYWDETVYLQNAKVISEGRDNYSELDYRPPLISVFYALGFRIWDHVYVANIVQGLLTALGVLLIYLLTLKISDERAALLAAGFLAFSPKLVEFSHHLLTGMPALSLSLWALLCLTRRTPPSLFLAGALCSLAVLMRYSSLFLAIYLIIYGLFFRAKLREILWVVAGGLLTLLPYLVWAQVVYGSFLSPFTRARRIIMEYSPYTPPSVFVHGLVEIFPALALAGFGFAVVRLAFRRERSQICLLAWGVLFFAYSMTITHKEVRYILPIAITVIPLSAIAWVQLWDVLRVRRRLRPLAAIAFTLVVMIEVAPTVQRFSLPLVNEYATESVQVARYLVAASEPDETIYAINDFPVLAFYTGRRTISLMPWQAEFPDDWRTVMSRPGFYVYYDQDEDTGLLPDKSFLDAASEFEPVRNFESVVVFRYRGPGGSAP